MCRVGSMSIAFQIVLFKEKPGLLKLCPFESFKVEIFAFERWSSALRCENSLIKTGHYKQSDQGTYSKHSLAQLQYDLKEDPRVLSDIRKDVS